MNAAGTMEWVKEFDKKHGDSLFLDGWVYFEDGARREVSAIGLQFDPPSDPKKRAEARIYFYKVARQRALNAFEDRKRQLLLLSQSYLNERFDCPPPPLSESAAKADLAKYAEAVKDWSKRLAEAESEREAAITPEEKERAKTTRINREANQEFIQAISEIEL